VSSSCFIALRAEIIRITRRAPCIRVNDAQNLAAAHAEKNNPLLAIISAVVNPLDAEWITKSISSLLKRHAMLTKIRGGLIVVLFKIFHT
jgi:hypothetical protein